MWLQLCYDIRYDIIKFGLLRNAERMDLIIAVAISM